MQNRYKIIDAVPADVPIVDAQHPWPGLSSYTEAMQTFFFGRDKEIEELLGRVRNNNVTILAGAAGLGKTSLLQAGLFPRLRAQGWMPIYLRLEHHAEAEPPAQQIRNGVADALAQAGCPAPKTTLDNGETSLWEWFHRRSFVPLDRQGTPLTLLLVLDQFEELFTLSAARHLRRQELVDQLAGLTENRMPLAVAARVGEAPELLERYDIAANPCRLLFSLREDYLPELKSLRRTLPSLGHNHQRLLPLDGGQALEIAMRPGLMAPEAAAAVIRETAGIDTTDADYKFLEISPPILGLLLQELNAKRLEKRQGRIDAHLVTPQLADDVLLRFYRRCLEGLPEAARILVEDHLLTDLGHRDSLALDQCHRLLRRAGMAAPQAITDALVRRHLLQPLQQYGRLRLELAHDVLVGPVVVGRAERLKHDTQTRLEGENAALRRSLQTERQAWLAGVAVAVLALAGLGYSTYANHQKWQDAENRYRMEQQTVETLASELSGKLAPVAAARIVLQDVFGRYLPRWKPRWEYAAAEGAVTAVAAEETVQAPQPPVQPPAAPTASAPPAPPPAAAGNTERRNRIATYLAQGDASLEQDRPAEALAQYRQGLALAEERARKDAGDKEGQRDLALAYSKVGDALLQQNDPAGALEYYRKDLATTEALVRRHAGNGEQQRDLSVSYNKIGEVLLQQGDVESALAHYRLGLAIREGLVRQKPDDPERQRDLSLGYENMGNALLTQGHGTEALDYYRKDLAITEALARQKPADTERQRDLSVSYDKVGDALLQQNDLAGALEHYRKETAIAEKLAAREPRNALWQEDLGIGYRKLAAVLARQGDTAQAARYQAKAQALHLPPTPH